MIRPKIIWSEARSIGQTADGYTIEVGCGLDGRVRLKVNPPSGSAFFQACPTVDNAKAIAEAEIEHHRKRSAWTK